MAAYKDFPLGAAPAGACRSVTAVGGSAGDFVLSNSTAGDCGHKPRHHHKLVLAPEKWYAHTKKSALYLPDWQLIETD